MSQPDEAIIGVRAEFPGFITPCLPTLRPTAPTAPGWVHEIKFDGYRIQLRRRGGSTRALTRNGYDWRDRFPGIITAADALPGHDFIVDAEAVVLDELGRPDMAMLRSSTSAAWSKRRCSTSRYVRLLNPLE